ncbi:MAG TPA: PQQ-dependent sugar dehydrogenase [Bacteriovoracaceae bacterium]|nr:PQQ-dependent sugar dehydrogenase [Bacteriovoracaceae bacterium]
MVWGFDFLPYNKIIFSERSGQISILDPGTGAVTALSGEPEVLDQGEGRLLDLRTDPDWVYFCFSAPGMNNSSLMTLARAQLQATSLVNLERIYISDEPRSRNIHLVAG